MNKLIKKIVILAAPLFLVTVCYIIIDPFQNMPFHAYHDFDVIMLSRGDISTAMYLRNVDNYKYNSFIFGSSRSTAQTSKEWQKYLTKGSVPFSFGAWNESIEGIYRRLKLIDSLGKPINNAFILVDVDNTFKIGPIVWDHYLITHQSKESYYVGKYYSYLQNTALIISSIDYAIFHTKRKYMTDFVGVNRQGLDLVNNDWDPNSEHSIALDSVNYYKNSKFRFYKRPYVQRDSMPQINESVKKYLTLINAIFKKKNTNYKIVIAPLFDQVGINLADLSLINQIFGKQNVFNYSGVNDLTSDVHNYNSDALHYRKKLGNVIFKRVYK